LSSNPSKEKQELGGKAQELLSARHQVQTPVSPKKEEKQILKLVPGLGE
jgi:hypothetical protein